MALGLVLVVIYEVYSNESLNVQHLHSLLRSQSLVAQLEFEGCFL